MAHLKQAGACRYLFSGCDTPGTRREVVTLILPKRKTITKTQQDLSEFKQINCIPNLEL